MLLCALLSDFGGYYRTDHSTLLFSLDFFYHILSVLEILLEQLHASFVTRREAQHDVTDKAQGFLLGTGSDFLRDFGHSMSPLYVIVFS